MSNNDLHPLAAAYLKRLESLSRDVPRERRNELMAEVTEHLAEAIPPETSMAEADETLDRFGSQEEIIAAELAQGGAVRIRGTAREGFALLLLLFGGFIFLVGWLVGAYLLWSSKVWTLRDKLLGTLLFPGGLAGILLFGLGTGSSSGSSGTICDAVSVGKHRGNVETHCHTVTHAGGGSDLLGPVLLVIVLLLPVVTAAYLAVRASRGRTVPARELV